MNSEKLQVISKFGSVVQPAAMTEKSDHEKKHTALVTRRSQLLDMINQEKNRIKQTWDEDAKQSIRETLETLEKQLKSVDAQLAKMIASDTANARKIEILNSVIGVGPVTISTLIAELPELGEKTDYDPHVTAGWMGAGLAELKGAG